MSNNSYKKSFNFRSGVQVDNYNFIVNPNGLVGIGTSVPTGFLDIRSTGDNVALKVVGLVTVSSLAVSGFSTFYDNSTFYDDVRIGSAITFNASSGTVGATTFYGSAAGLTGIYAVAVDGWYVDSANSGIFTSFKVGIGTTNPQYSLQIGSDPLFGGEGISFNALTGDITSTGGIAATSFTGNLDSSNLTGTIINDRLPSNISVGIVTATTFYGNLVGTAATADSITTTSNITVNSINSGFSSSGISTVSTTLHVSGNIGVGTLNPNAQIHLRKSGISSIQLTSDGSNSSTITFGRSVTITSSSSNAQLRFGNTSISYPDSTQQSLDIINYDTGNLNFYLNPGGSGTGSFNWFKSGITQIMTLTSNGNLGINYSSPTSKLYVDGNCYLSGIVTVGTSLSVTGSLDTNNATVNGTLDVDDIILSNNLIVSAGKIGIKNNSPTYDLQVGDNPSISGVGISTNGNIITSGIITASNGFTSGIGVTNPVLIQVTDNVLIFTVVGVGQTSLILYSD